MLLVPVVVGKHVSGSNVLDRLVAELEILLEGDGVLDLEPDDGGSAKESAAKETPL